MAHASTAATNGGFPDKLYGWLIVGVLLKTPTRLSGPPTKKNIHVDLHEHSFSMPAERRYLDGCIELNHHPSYSKKKRGHKKIKEEVWYVANCTIGKSSSFTVVAELNCSSTADKWQSRHTTALSRQYLPLLYRRDSKSPPTSQW